MTDVNAAMLDETILSALKDIIGESQIDTEIDTEIIHITIHIIIHIGIIHIIIYITNQN